MAYIAIDGIAIWKLIYYIFCFISSIFVCWRNGRSKVSGWVLLALFCLIRIINCSAQLAAWSNDTGTARIVADATSLIGISPLLLSGLAIISRVYVLNRLDNILSIEGLRVNKRSRLATGRCSELLGPLYSQPLS